MVTAMNEDNKASATPPSQANKRKSLLWATLIIILLVICWLLYWFTYLQFHESTDDAYSNGNMVNVNSAIAGSVIAYYADNTDLVLEGQLLVQLDRTYYQIIYEKELNTLASVVLQVKQIYDNVLVNQANVKNKKISEQRARTDFQNRSDLVQSQAVSTEDFTHSHEDLSMAQQSLKQAEYQLQIAIDAMGTSSLETHPLIEQQRAKVREAYFNLQHCSIYASTTGYIAQRSVEIGQSITPITNLMAIIPTSYVWVDANFKETQLSFMRIGQPATVWFDLYGSKTKFEGKVLGIASGTGSLFSLIPPQNATGNWIKIVQRLPVRISLDPEKIKAFPIRLGISATVNVNISNQELPMLAQVPLNKPIATTNIFDIQFDSVNKIIDEVIRKNNPS